MKHHHHTHHSVSHIWHAIAGYFHSHHPKKKTYSRDFERKVQRFHEEYIPGKAWMQDADNI